MSARQLDITTPQGATLTFEIATVGERLFAVGVDYGILIVVAIALVLVGLLGVTLTGSLALILVVLGAFVLRYGYFVFFEIHWVGATPGKRLLGVRVIDKTGAPLGVDAVIARNVLRDFETFGVLLLVLAGDQFVGTAPPWLRWPAVAWLVAIGLLPFFSQLGQRAGDFVAGTVVVRATTVPPLPPDPHATDDFLFSVSELSVYGELELETLSSILRDANNGAVEYDALLAVATTISKRIGRNPADAAQRPLVFLRSFYSQQRSALERKLLLGRRKASKHEK